MALKLVEGKEVRVPGSAIPAGQRRQGALGKLDSMGWRQFQEMPLVDRRMSIMEARGKLLGSKDSESVKCIVIYRDNSFYSSMFASVKEKLGEKAMFVSFPRETEDLSESQLRYLEHIFHFAELKKISVLADNTMHGKIPSSLQSFRYKKLDSFLTDSSVMESDAARFGSVLKQIGCEMAEDALYDIAVVLGKVEDGTIRSPLFIHGISVEINGKEVYLDQRSPEINNKDVLDGMYRFIETSLKEGALMGKSKRYSYTGAHIRVHPAFLIDGKLVLLKDYNKISMGPYRLYSIGGEENIIHGAIDSLEVLADRHIPGKALYNGYPFISNPYANCYNFGHPLEFAMMIYHM